MADNLPIRKDLSEVRAAYRQQTDYTKWGLYTIFRGAFAMFFLASFRGNEAMQALLVTNSDNLETMMRLLMMPLLAHFIVFFLNMVRWKRLIDELGIEDDDIDPLF